MTSWEWMQQNQTHCVQVLLESGGRWSRCGYASSGWFTEENETDRKWIRYQRQRGRNADGATQGTLKLREGNDDDPKKNTTWQVVPTTPEWNKSIIHHQNYYHYHHHHRNVLAPPGTTGTSITVSSSSTRNAASQDCGRHLALLLEGCWIARALHRSATFSTLLLPNTEFRLREEND